MGSPSHAVVMTRGPSGLQGMTTPTWQASVKGAQVRWLNSPLVYKRAWPCWPTRAHIRMVSFKNVGHHKYR
jgi:hypothetical protein